jgi:catalase
MADGIEVGVFLDYEFGIQVMRDDGTDSFEGIDLLDPTSWSQRNWPPRNWSGS